MNLNFYEENKSLYFKNNNNFPNKIIKTKKNHIFKKIILVFFFFENIILLIYFLLYKIFFAKKGDSISEKSNAIKILPREEALDSGLPFIKKCIDGILIDNKKYEKVTNPKISAVIPCYNCGKYIKSSVLSIQNQNMKDIEIIIVNDKSNEETVNILNELKKEEPRLEVYHNEKNMKLFYTRTFGVLQARGEYIVTLDADDMFLDSDVFDNLYQAAEDGNFDIISYRIFEAYDYIDRSKIEEHFLNYKEHNLKVYQPELSCYAISSNGKLKYNDINIWGKLFRTSVYKSAINLLGIDEYSKPLMWGEDTIMLYVITNMASSYKYIRKYCYFHYIRKASSSTGLQHNDKIYGDLFKINLELDLTKKDCYNIPAIFLLKNAKFFKRADNNLSLSSLRKVVQKIVHSQNIDNKYKIEVDNTFKDYLFGVNNNPINDSKVN